jgi:cyclic beta-1,2-glucan synthetase
MERVSRVAAPYDSVQLFAGDLAGRHSLDRGRGRRREVRRLLDTLDRQFGKIYSILQEDPDSSARHPRIAEWLLDNEYLIRENLRLVGEALPPDHYRRLPRFAGKTAEGLPRILDFARETAAESRLQLDLERLARLVLHYQGMYPLTIGELWALPAMLRLALLEILAKIAFRVFGVATPPPGVRALPTEAAVRRSDIRSDSGWGADGGAQRRGASRDTRGPEARGTGISRSAQAALTGVAGGIGSLRAIAAHDWKQFVESSSRVDRVLRRDPLHMYDRMDFESRDSYRRAVEELARYSGETEESVAVEVYRLARLARIRGATREAHVGYYLIDSGRAELENRVGYEAHRRVRLLRFVLRHARPLYFGLSATLTALIEAGLGGALALAGTPPVAMVSMLLLGLVPALSVALGLVNWLSSLWVPPRILPKIDLKHGVPDDCRTVVAIPVLVKDGAEIDGLLTHIETLYQGNADPNVWWALLTDFADAPAQEMPGDEALLRRAAQGVSRLNSSWREDGRTPFFLLHRQRLWNPGEACWMGWERKRGKLHQLNRLLIGETDTGLEGVEGDLGQLDAVRYVITLDADTHLPPGNAARLIGTLAHPLNVAGFDEHGGVGPGYTVLQPGIETGLHGGKPTPFARIMEADSGYDLYSHAVSDVYQDLFGEGIFAGKGIYEIASFERSLEGRVPENALLSHDLFEGIHGRVGLVSDIQVFEEYPTDVVSNMRRLHRWIRGDWQLLPWLLPRVPARDGGRLRGTLGALDRWKILDNLRRSLVAPSLLTLALAGWILGVASPWLWTALLVAVLGVPSFLGAASVTRRLIGSRRARHWQTATARGPLDLFAPPSWASVARWFLALVLLPYEALVATDAIGRTLVRLTLTRRHLLQWTTAAHSAPSTARSGSATDPWTAMAMAPLLAVSTLAAVVLLRPAAVYAAVGPAVLWLVSPQIAGYLSRPSRRARRTRVSPADERFLRSVALRTWLFFESLLTPEDHWLPPDNYQEGREGAVARRTSPTNVGMMLTATLSAFDLGYIGPLELEALILNTLDSMHRLDRYRGHFLNWYATDDLRVLDPRYVSTVDSGNLAVALLTLRNGVDEVVRRPVYRHELRRGLCDTLESATAVLASGREPRLHQAAAAVENRLAELKDRVENGAGSPTEWASLVREIGQERLAELDETVASLADAAADLHPLELLRDVRVWMRKIHQHVALLRRLNDTLCPWLELIADPPCAYAGALPGSTLEGSWQELLEVLSEPVTPLDLPATGARARTVLERLDAELGAEAPASDRAEASEWSRKLAGALQAAETAGGRLVHGLRTVSDTATRLVGEMDFGFLYDRHRGLFHIGFNASTEEIDPNYYDLLASEARLASYLAIANGEAPQEHWLRLGRPFARVGEQRVLLSWGATMFEYLLPNLFLKLAPHSLLDVSCRAAVRGQIRYARRRGIPWGVSESGYHQVGSDASYQYRAFGVPELGLQRGIGERVVITPYACVLALSLSPVQVVRNLRRLVRMGLLGPLGLYEAIDFGPEDRMDSKRPQLVRSYMAHHQGMILLAIGSHLTRRGMVSRFHANPRMTAIEFLLHERTPWRVPVREAWTDRRRAAAEVAPAPPALRSWPSSLASALPETQLLSNETYSVLVKNTGAGGSYWKGLALTRWDPDPTLDDGGTFVYVQDMDSGELWSAGLAPTGARPDSTRVGFAPHMVEFRRHDRGIVLRMRVGVPSDDDVEIRYVALTNESASPRRLAVTSYGEVVLARADDYRRHPAYSKLFVRSSYEEDLATLLYWRRARSPEERAVALAHTLVFPGDGKPPGLSFETDRQRFLGRTESVREPLALRDGGDLLSAADGTSLDPIFALRCQLELRPRETRQLAFLTAAGESRHRVLAALDFYRSFGRITSAFEMARQGVELSLHDLGIEPRQMASLQSLLSLLLHSSPALRAGPDVLERNERSQQALWKHGISGDHPILLVKLRAMEEIGLVEELLPAHRYWRARGLTLDLVVLDLESAGYARPLRDRLRAAIEEADGGPWLGRAGGIHVVGIEACDTQDQVLLESTAAAVLRGDRGSLRQQLRGARRRRTRLPAFVPVPHAPLTDEPTPGLEPPDGLRFFNDLGGFSQGGREYVTRTRPGVRTPAPWVNVIANAEFGCQVSEAGLGCTWSMHSAENRLTPWRNDPVSDRPAEALYLRDEETGAIWSPTLLPAGSGGEYEAAHGAGYSVFRHNSHGLLQRLTVFCPPDAPLKIVKLHLANCWKRQRRITATYYAEWVLGSSRARSAHHVIPAYDPREWTLLARNPFHESFASRIAFLGASEPPHGLTTDRMEFLGEPGDPARPAALCRIGLSDTVRAGTDPCAAYQLHVDLAPGEAREVHFILGQERDRNRALARVREYRSPDAVEAAWKRLREFWDGLLGSLTVLVCRMWARAALYQSSGAFGFRDQLQDSMALFDAAPHLAREHILEAAGRQFLEGDVLHWWHPGTATGVRTRCSDDLLWLPYVTAEYVCRTGDASILEADAPYLRGAPLEPDEAERYGQFEIAARMGSLYEHCVRAIERGATQGPHGLPLIGSCDWNDGMNRVGLEGRGESVWLGWFLYAVLRSFTRLARERLDDTHARMWEELAEEYRGRIEEAAWDGDWYLRAFYDDGTPMGSAAADEARIDAISQAWAVFSGAAPDERAARALDSASRALIRDEERLILLLEPPFDRTERDPGYIKGYPPGVRENGGQYTHAAVWLAWAFAARGDGERALQLFDYMNPILRATTTEEVERYRVEPYAVAADIYSAPPLVGRGGWTWYTGSAAWLYRLGVEAILGLRREGELLRIEPCLPPAWAGYEARFRVGGTVYRIRVDNGEGTGHGVRCISLDGDERAVGPIPAVDDGKTHEVVVQLGASSA